MSSAVLRHFRLLQPEFLGCAKLKDSARGDVTHTSHAGGRSLWPGGPNCACVLQPSVKFFASRTVLRTAVLEWFGAVGFVTECFHDTSVGPIVLGHILLFLGIIWQVCLVDNNSCALLLLYCLDSHSALSSSKPPWHDFNLEDDILKYEYNVV